MAAEMQTQQQVCAITPEKVEAILKTRSLRLQKQIRKHDNKILLLNKVMNHLLHELKYTNDK